MLSDLRAGDIVVLTELGRDILGRSGYSKVLDCTFLVTARGALDQWELSAKAVCCGCESRELYMWIEDVDRVWSAE